MRAEAKCQIAHAVEQLVPDPLVGEAEAPGVEARRAPVALEHDGVVKRGAKREAARALQQDVEVNKTRKRAALSGAPKVNCATAGALGGRRPPNVSTSTCSASVGPPPAASSSST